MRDQNLLAPLEGLLVAIVDPHFPIGYAPLGYKKPQEPCDVLMDKHPRVVWKTNQSNAIPDGELTHGRSNTVAGSRHHDGVITRRLDDATTTDQPHNSMALSKRMAGEMKDLRPPAVGPHQHFMPAHIPHDGSVSQGLAAEVTGRLVPPDLTDVSDVYQSRSVIAKQDRRPTTHAVVERPR